MEASSGNGRMVEDGVVLFADSHGLENRGKLLRLTRFLAVFELYDASLLKLSEVLTEFAILVDGRTAYSGKTVVGSLVDSGSHFTCEVKLDFCQFDPGFLAALEGRGNLPARFEAFVDDWQKAGKVLPEFKLAVAEIETFLVDLRRWVDEAELGSGRAGNGQHKDWERETLDELSPRIVSLLNQLFRRYEEIAQNLDPERIPPHRIYVQRHLHPLVLCAPFARRTYQKPLGYAGDYEMVNMMMRDSREGDSLFAKLFNVWLLSQESAAAHRNRIEYLTRRLVETVAAATRRERRARVYSLGCGPAWEWQRFLAQSPLSSHADVVLVDFDSETLEHARHVLQNAAERYHRAPSLQFVKKSVQQLIKETFRAGPIQNDSPFDLIYCAGLFDYLPDQICRGLANLFYESLAPGGVVLCTNVAPANANRGSLELILDWHLRYRDRRGMGGLVPPGFPPSQVGICTDLTGSNVFLELRKPDGC